MTNRDIDEAWRYHDATKHSYASVHSDRHFLDWSNQPRPLKIYRAPESIPLPRELPRPEVSALTAISGTPPTRGDALPDLHGLAYVLFLSAGITKTRKYPGGEISFRAASCTGALYEIDLYVVCQDLSGLEAGVYHFDPAEFTLRRLRERDHRGALIRATAGDEWIRHAPVTIVCTGTYWRNAWKYRARTYRHFGWDNGTILANLLAAASALSLPARIVCGFIDDEVNALLSLDVDREVALSMVALGRGAVTAPDPPPVSPLALDVIPVSRSEVDYPEMRRVHAASALNSGHEVAAWREGAAGIGETVAASSAGLIPLRPLSEAMRQGDALEDVIVRRGSTRRFQRGASWSFAQLSTALVLAMQGVPADFLGTSSVAPGERAAPLLNELYLIINAVEAVPPGAYVVRREGWELELLKEGNFRDTAGYLGLEQELPADASVVGFFLADFRRVLERLGNRGYRATQLEAGILGGRMYLAAYAQRLGASGLTFYDDDVVSFFSPHAIGKNAVFCIVLGQSASRRR